MTAPDRREAWDAAVAHAVESSCAAQGVPVQIEDEAVLEQVARIMDAGRPQRRRRAS